MLKSLLLATASSLLVISCVASRAAERDAPPEPTLTPSPTSTALPPPPVLTAPMQEPGPALPQEPQAPPSLQDTATATPALVSEVLPEAQPPQPTAVRGGTSLALPDGTTVVRGGCSSDGQCHWYNFYWAPTHEAVVQDGESQIKVEHELCHAHQHWTINGGAPLDPADFDLHSWYGTAEAQSFTAAVDGLPWPWSHSAENGLEDFAWTCAYWYLDPAHLLAVSPERYAWAAQNLP